MTEITDQDILNMTVEELTVHNSEAARWSYLLGSLVLNDPLMHDIVMLTARYANEAVKTMGVTVVENIIKLYYSPTFLGKLTDAEAKWVLMHEMLHILLHHCTIRKSSDPRLAKMQNYAADLAINQLLPDDKGNGVIRRPRKEIINVLMPDMYNFPKMLSMEQYFQLLRKKFDPNTQPPPPPPQQEDGDEEGQDQGGSGDPQDKNEGDEGDEDGQGSPTPGEGKPDEGPGQGQDPMDVGGDLVDNHEGWSDVDGDMIDSIIRDAVDQFQKSGQQWGSISGNLKEMITAAQKPQVKWWKVLRELLGHLISTKKTTTFKRPSRRYGYPFPGTKRVHVDKVLVCGDTSASVSDAAWSRFLAELNKIVETHPVDLVMFDVGITYGPRPFSRRVKKFELEGRGGTDFQAIFDLADKGKYQSMVILTDGGAPAVDKPKYVKDVIWCLVGEGTPCHPAVNWGTVVRIKEHVDM